MLYFFVSVVLAAAPATAPVSDGPIKVKYSTWAGRDEATMLDEAKVKALEEAQKEGYSAVKDVAERHACSMILCYVTATGTGLIKDPTVSADDKGAK